MHSRLSDLHRDEEHATVLDYALVAAIIAAAIIAAVTTLA